MTGSALAGTLALAVAWVAVGGALLRASGLLRTARPLLPLLPLALVTGWAFTGVAATVLLMVGLSASPWQLALTWGAAVVLAAATARRRLPRADVLADEPTGTARNVLARAGAAAACGYLVALLVRALVPLGQLHPDAWTQWLAKAMVIYRLGGLDTGAGGFTSQANADYPPLDPALEATTFRFAGTADYLVLPFAHWLVLAAFVGAAAFLLRRRAPAHVVWPSLAMLVLAPKLTSLAGSSLADEPLAIMIGLATICGALWLLDGSAGLAPLVCLFLAAAALTKNEGAVLAALVGLALATGGSRRWVARIAFVLTPLAAFGAWQLWIGAHDVPPNVAHDFGRLLHPGRLADHVSYVRYGATSLLDHLFSPGEWLLIVPATLVLGLVAARRRSRLAPLALGVPLAATACYSIVYWAGNGICTWMPARSCDGTWRDIEWLVSASADRIVAPVVVELAVLFPLLISASSREGRLRRNT